jgi:hypothetical protein
MGRLLLLASLTLSDFGRTAMCETAKAILRKPAATEPRLRSSRARGFTSIQIRAAKRPCK